MPSAEELQLAHDTDLALTRNLEYFCDAALRIKDKAGRIVPFIWNESQRYVHKKIERQKEVTGKVRALILKGRQLGISTYVGARYYHRTAFHPGFGQRTYILTHEDDATQTLFGMVKLMQDNMPPDHVHPLKAANANELDFAGMDSGYRVGTAKNTKGKGRSQTIQNFHGSEMAFWADAKTHRAGVMQAIPDARDTEIILESTANGVGGAFYDMWQEAERGESDYLPIFLPWYWGKEYRRAVPADFAPSIAEAEYGELYDLDPEQIVWLHFKNVELGAAAGAIDPLFRQEYPGTAQEAFQATGQDSYISSDLVMRARKNTMPEDPNAPLLMGVDVAAGGKDVTRMRDRQGQRIGHKINVEMHERDPMVIADRIATEIVAHDVFRTFIDLTGVGSGVYYRLRQLNFGDRIAGINFGALAAEEAKYANKRAEMYGRFKEWLQDPGGADLDDDNVLHEDVCAASFRYRMTKKGRQLLIEEKEAVKKRLERQRSPDDGDAVILTFAEHVVLPRKHTRSWKDEVHAGRNQDWMTS